MLSLLSVAALGLSVSASAAQNSVNAPLWSCNLQGEMSGKTIGLIIGVQVLEGEGLVTCTSIDGAYAEMPVKLEVFGLGLGLGFNEVDRVEVLSAGIGLVAPQGMIGKYSVGASAGATLIEAGITADAAIFVSKRGGLGFEIGLQGQKARGLEAHLHAKTLSITAL